MTELPPFRLQDDDAGPATPLAPGLMLLEASAGTGKTYTITGIVARLVLEEGLDLERIAVMTFTRAATAELAERIRALLAALPAAFAPAAVDAERQPFVAWVQRRLQALPDGARQAWHRRLLAALDRCDRAAIATIHASAYRLAVRHAALVGLDPGVELVDDDGAARARWARDWFRRHLRDRDPWLASLGGSDPLALLERLAALVERHPLAAGHPPPLSPADAAARLDQARHAWPSQREQLLALASTTPLSRSSIHHPDKLLGRLDAIAAWLEQGGTLDGAVPALWDAGKLARLPSDYAEACRALGAWIEELQDLWARVLAQAADDYRSELQARCQRERRLTPADAQLALLAALRGAQGAELARRIGATYDAVLIDEFQDTDLAQWEIVRRCFAAAGRRLVLIGDPKQAIYAFRGADLHAYLHAAEAVPAERRYTLSTNFRSDAPLVEALNHAYLGPPASPDPLPAPFGGLGIAYRRVGARHPARCASGALAPEPLQLLLLPPAANKDAAEEAASQAVADEIVRLLDPEQGWRLCGADGARPLAPSDIAVLVRTHAQAARVHRALRQRGLAAVRRDRTSVFGSEAARALRALLAASLAGGREPALRLALATRLIGCPAAVLADPDQAAACLGRAGEAFLELGEALRESVPAWWYRLADHDFGWGSPRRRLAQLGDGGRLRTDTLHLVELLAAVPLPPPLLPDWLGARAAAAEAEADDETRRRLERDDNAVVIATVHASKGLEWPVVFEAFAWSGAREPEPPCAVHAPPADDTVLALTWRGREALAAAARREALSEGLRQLYVGLTRAAQRQYLLWLPDGKAGINPLAWFLGGRALGALPPATDPADRLPQAFTAALEAPRLPAHPALGVRDLRQVPPVSDALPPARAAPAAPASTDGRDEPPAVAAHAARWQASSFTAIAGLLAARDEAEPPAALLSEPAPDEPPTGAAWGDLVHRLLEAADLAAWAAAPERVEAELAAAADAQGLALSRAQAARAAAQLHAVASRPLPGLKAALAALPPQRLAREWPLRLAVRRSLPLAPLFAAAEPELSAALGDACLPSGVFTAILDAVAIAPDGRWQVIDWKTNRLPAYDERALRQALLDHRYLLQAALYLAALHRWLRLRLGPAYRPAAHLGCAQVVFLRGCNDGELAVATVEPIPALLTALEDSDA